MKVFNYLTKSALAAAIITIFTYGCDNLQSPEPIDVIDSTRTATIQGKVLANLDETNDTTDSGAPQVQYEIAPAGTKLKLVLDYEDFANVNHTQGVQEEDLTYTLELDGSGNYSIELPVPNWPVDARIYLDDFAAQIETDEGDEDAVFYYESENFPFNPYYDISDIREGFTKIIPDLKYSKRNN